MQSVERQRGMGGLAIFAIIALMAVLGGALVYTMGKSKTNTAMQENTAVTETVTPAVTPTGVVSADTSDAGLAKDSSEVDTKLNAANADSANIDAGLNDQQGNLSEQ